MDLLSSSGSESGHSEHTSTSHGKQIKKKRKVSFNSTWLVKYEWLRKINNSLEYVQCVVCASKFSYSSGGEYNIKKHMKSASHIKLMSDSKNSQQKSVASFFNTDKDKCISAIPEAVFVYHTVNHAHSYLSATCSSSLFNTMFPDSKIATKFHCARTKCTKIATSVLAPAFKRMIVRDIGTKPFSIGTDASNHGNIKTFPLIVRYFDANVGVCTKLLAFYNLTTETSKDIATSLKSNLNAAGLRIENVTAFSADNASVNFGKNQSVYTELKIDNPNIEPMGCVCHILNNCAKKGREALRFDLEAIVCMCFNEFSNSTKNATELKEFMEFCSEEWSDLQRHVPTRWLTLIPAIDRILKHFESLKSYFLSKNRKRPYLTKFFECEVAEAYLGFVSNVCSVLQSSIYVLEKEDTSAINIYPIMNDCLKSLQNKREECFYGSLAATCLAKCDDDGLVSRFKKEADVFFNLTIDYLKKKYHFNEKYNFLSKMKLQNPSYNDFVEIVNKFVIPNVDIDLLFEEFIKLKAFVSTTSNFDALSSVQKWVSFFRSNDAPNFKAICNFVFSLPVSNAMCERVFSLMNVAWRKERNRLVLETLEAELMIKMNCNLSCNEFDQFLRSDNIGKDIVNKIGTSEKYQS